MIDHVWSVLCSHAVIDRDTNNVSIHSVLEQLNVVGEPAPDLAIPVAFEVVTLWARTTPDIPAQGMARVTLIDPLQNSTTISRLKIDLSETERARHRVIGRGMPASQPGRYRFQVDMQIEGETEWRQMAIVPLTVVFTSNTGEILLMVGKGQTDREN